MPRLAYWRAQGWNVLVPDHRGSTGHGRAYQQALRGRWGELDVSDVIDAIVHAHGTAGARRSTPPLSVPRPAVSPRSESPPARPELLAAAIVAYPVTDLADLAERSHRFERHYTDTLVGSLPQSAALYSERSPMEFAARLADVPVLVMHGDSDPVVPVEQSRAFVDRCRAAGGTVEFVEYEGEGHGFRKPENQLDEYARMQSFLAVHVPGG
jgi:dipeptidyl aminopeptidase/acylaminoacyl peptidase